MFKKFAKSVAVLALATALPLSGVVAANAAPAPTVATQASNVGISSLAGATIATPAKASSKKAAPKVKFKKIGNATVAKKSSTKTVKPSYTKSKGTKIKSAKVTVKNTKGKTIAKNKNSVKLKAGSYKLQNTIKYTYKSGKKTVTKTTKYNQSFKVTVKKAKAKAHAPKVTIGKIGNKTVSSKNSAAKVAPVYKKDKAAKVTSAKVTVTNSKGKPVVKNKTNATLKPGSYTVKSNVSYSYKSGKKTIKKSVNKTEKIMIKAKAASTTSYNTSVINKLNEIRVSKGLPKLKTTGVLDGPTNAWTQDNFSSSRSPRIADGMTTLFTFEMNFSGGANVERTIDELKISKSFMNQLTSKKNTHIAVSNKDISSGKLVGLSLAGF